MSGNVWEWTRSLWGKDYKPEFDYPYDPEDITREHLEASPDFRRVLRGGSFNFPAQASRCASRVWYLPDDRSLDFGFRVVLSP
jgi:formylglycine-generating enzyme required for sulfatase activity